jgi:hypothetical protein
VAIETTAMVVVSCVRFGLNPHPFKTKRVRHPKADPITT